MSSINWMNNTLFTICIFCVINFIFTKFKKVAYCFTKFKKHREISQILTRSFKKFHKFQKSFMKFQKSFTKFQKSCIKFQEKFHELKRNSQSLTLYCLLRSYKSVRIDKISILKLEGIIKKISYERRGYESVDEKSLS